MISIRQLVERIGGQIGVDPARQIEIVADRPGKDAAYLLDASHAGTALGWSPTTDLAEGLDQTLGWVKANLAVLRTLPWSYSHKK